jgi:cytochrome c-type biogenesis protein CcmH/NrfF
MTIACAVHWYESLLFLAPVAITMGVMAVMSRVERRREAREEREAAAEPSPIYH